MGIKEERIKSIAQIHYSNQKIQDEMIEFAKDREVVPQYIGGGFGKRPDILQFKSDVMGLVNKGTSSFHVSQEVWNDVLRISSDLPQQEMNKLRKEWDLLIDIDSPFLDCSKVAAKLIIAALESHGIKNYGIKYSGSKGFHIIVSSKAFPEYFGDKKTSEMFPEWARAISSYLMSVIKRDYYREVGNMLNSRDIEKRTGIKAAELEVVHCLNCNRAAKKGQMVIFECNLCGMKIDRRDFKLTNRKLKCLNEKCAGNLEVLEEKEYYYCENCKDFDNEKIKLNSEKNPEMFEKLPGINAELLAKLDLVLVSPRHLFRMPYSLHEKTGLASVVIGKEDIEKFEPNMANPLKVKVRKYLPNNEKNEGLRLLRRALEWKGDEDKQEKKDIEKKYIDKEVDNSLIKEEMFPAAIKKLLLGVKDGRKRGLFILITFFKALNFSGEYINKRIREWNERNEQPLKEGYVKSQIEWHLKQKKKILPPNYENESFYKDLGLIEEKQKDKNPITEVLRKIR